MIAHPNALHCMKRGFQGHVLPCLVSQHRAGQDHYCRAVIGLKLGEDESHLSHLFCLGFIICYIDCSRIYILLINTD